MTDHIRCRYCKRYVPRESAYLSPVGPVCDTDTECLEVFWAANPMADNPCLGEPGDD